MSVKSPESTSTVTLPKEYIDFQDIFSKEKATALSPHQSWDCAIELLPNAMPPKSCLYPLSPPEKKAMEEYIEEALTAGCIRLPKSPAALFLC